MASAASDAAPRAEFAVPPRSLVAAITGAASGVETTAASAFNPRLVKLLPGILHGPHPAPLLACPHTRFCMASISMNARTPPPGMHAARDLGHRTMRASSADHATIALARCPLQLDDGSFSNSHRHSSEGTFRVDAPECTPIYAVDRGLVCWTGPGRARVLYGAVW